MIDQIFIVMLSLFFLLFLFEIQRERGKVGKKKTKKKEENKVLYVGTYTKKEFHVDGKGKGIYLLKANQEGVLESEGVVAELINPSYVTVSNDGKNLFSVIEVYENDGIVSSLHSFKIMEDYSLVPVNSVSIDGFALCHILLKNNGKFLFLTDYMGGILSMISIGMNKMNGFLKKLDSIQLSGNGPHEIRQTECHLHSTALSIDESLLFVADLGSDKIWIFDVDYENEKMLPNKNQPFLSLRPGSGPRHMSVHKNGHIYLINELDNTISILQFHDHDGFLKERDYKSTLPEGSDGSGTCADIHIHPNGRFLYGSNRGHDSIVVFEIKEDGNLSFVQHESTRGEYPRSFLISKDGERMYVANQNSDNIVEFYINKNSGKLKYTGNECIVGTPVSLSWK